MLASAKQEVNAVANSLIAATCIMTKRLQQHHLLTAMLWPSS